MDELTVVSVSSWFVYWNNLEFFLRLLTDKLIKRSNIGKIQSVWLICGHCNFWIH